MRILFIGTVDFSYSALKTLLENKLNVVGVITKSQSEFNSDFKDLSPLCLNNNIPFKFIENINDKASIDFIKRCKPDVIYCFGWSSLLKRDLLSIPQYGVIGFHPAALPANRGRHPIIWALVLGLKETASTFFIMNEGADTGEIISQTFVNIDKDDDAQSLYKKITEIALNQIIIFTNELIETMGKIKTISQHADEGNVWRKRSKKDGAIDFRMTSVALYNLVRALTRPYVGAHIVYKDQEIKVWKVQILDFQKDNIEPGKVINLKNEKIQVKTGDGAIELVIHEFIDLPLIGEYL